MWKEKGAQNNWEKFCTSATAAAATFFPIFSGQCVSSLSPHTHTHTYRERVKRALSVSKHSPKLERSNDNNRSRRTALLLSALLATCPGDGGPMIYTRGSSSSSSFTLSSGQTTHTHTQQKILFYSLTQKSNDGGGAVCTAFVCLCVCLHSRGRARRDGAST